MYAMVRSYTGQGAKELTDLLVEHKAEVEALLRSVSDLKSYSLIRTASGCTTITVCESKAGADDSLQKAKSWLAKNASHLGQGATPSVSEGAVELYLD